MLDITNSDLQDVDSDMKKTIKEFENITSVAETVNIAFDEVEDE